MCIKPLTLLGKNKMGARGDREEGKTEEEGKTKEEKPVEQGVMEVEINPSLLNNKLNFIISQLDQIIKAKK